MPVVDHVITGEVKAQGTVPGKFERQPNRFTTPFSADPDAAKEGLLPVEAGRYRLIWAPVCPWATRQIIVRELLGLDRTDPETGKEILSVGKADPIRPDVPWGDWAFTLDPGGIDPVLHIHLLSEVYYASDPAYTGRPTVPAVIDLTTRKVVNNDYFRLTNYWETEWKRYHKKHAPDLYPAELREKIDALSQWIFHDVNNGVYKAGFGQSQEAYDDAFGLVFAAYDKLEERLSHQRFLFGDYITDSDVRLYVTLARFDIAYFNGFRVNGRMLRDYPNLWGYARDLYAVHAFAAATDFDGIKKHYHLCCLQTNPDSILPVGPDEALWNEPAGREHLSKDPEHKFRYEEER